MRVLIVRGKTLGFIAGGLALCLFLAMYAAFRTGTSEPASADKVHRPIYSVDIPEKKVSLGINCAWDNGDIPRLLEILDEYDIKATFFLVGEWCDKYPDSVRALYQAGHEIGSHSDTHADMANLDEAGVVRELKASADKIEALTGQRPDLFRPPSGSYTSDMISIVEREGFYPIQWDCDSVDYKDPTADQMQERIMGKLRNGSIMLFHSGAKNTPGALGQIIEAIKAEGYEFVPVSKLIYIGNYTVDYEGRQHRADS